MSTIKFLKCIRKYTEEGKQIGFSYKTLTDYFSSTELIHLVNSVGGYGIESVPIRIPKFSNEDAHLFTSEMVYIFRSKRKPPSLLKSILSSFRPIKNDVIIPSDSLGNILSIEQFLSSYIGDPNVCSIT